MNTRSNTDLANNLALFTLRCVQPTWESTTTIGGWQITLGGSFISASYRSGWTVLTKSNMITIHIRQGETSRASRDDGCKEVRLYSIIVILSKSPLQLCLKYPQISTFSTQALNIPQISSYIHIPNSGLPSARQRCWRRRRPQRVEVVEKMWRSGGEKEGSTNIIF